MAILLDQTTKAEYDALAFASVSTRAAAVVSALSGTVVVEVYSGTDTLMASGTMAAPWATSSGATITVGEIAGAGLLVTTGGAPDASWYCQFRSGSRFVRGTFGVAGSGRDFVWSLASFQTGSRGTLGTVVLTVSGAPSGGLVLVTAPSITAFSGVATTAGSLLTVTPAVWQNELPYELIGTVSTVSATSAYLGVSASATPGYYAGMWLVIITGTTQPDNFTQTSAVIQSYDGASKTAFITQWINGNSLASTPTAGQTFKIIKSFPVDRKWQWNRNGSPIANQISGSYTTQAADIGASITVSEIAGVISDSNTGLIQENPIATTTATSAPVSISGNTNSRLVYNDELAYIGSFALPGAGAGIQSLPFFAAGGLFIKDVGGTKTLVVRGHKNATSAAEFAIPTVLGTAGPYASLPTASIIYPTLLGAALPLLSSGITIDPSSSGDTSADKLVTPQQISSTKMLFNFTAWGGYGISTHYRRPLDLADQVGANVEGPFCIADSTYQTNPKWAGTWYCPIPSEWQTALGGDVLSGQGNPRMSYSTYSLWSQGPSAMSFNTANITAALATKDSGNLRSANSTSTIQLATSANGTTDFYKNHCVFVSGLDVRRISAYDGVNKIATVDPAFGSAPSAGTAYYTIPLVAGRQLVGRSTSAPLQAAYNGYGTHMPVWNFSTVIGGMCIPENTDSLLIFARTGDNIYTYFQWDIAGAAGQQNAGIKIYDPGNPDPGPHSGSSFLKVYAYDLNDLAAVYANTKTFDQIKPYGLFKLTLPATLDSVYRRVVTGVAYDSSANKIYVSESSGPSFSPIIHVFQITRADSPVLVTAPTISTFFAATSSAGELLAATPGVYQYDDGVRFSGTIASTDLRSRPNANTAVFYIGSNASVSSTTDEYKNWRLVADFNGGQPPYVADAANLSCGIRSYDGATKCVTVEWADSWNPTIGGTWKLIKNYPILRKGQWKRNGTPISGEFTRAYQIKSADIGQSISYEETVGFVDWTFVQNGGSRSAPPTPLTSLTTTSAAYVSSSSFSSSARITSAADFSYIGSFISPVGFTTTKLSVVPASQSHNGQVSLLLSDYNGSSEILIPTLSNNSNPALLNPASVTRSSTDIFNGWMTNAKNGFGDQWISGTAALSGSSNIVVATVAYYNSTSRENIFIKRPANISSATSNNPFCVRATNQTNGRWTSGAIVEIPSSLQSALGGDLMVSSGAIAVASNNSQGPGGIVFSSADIDAASAKFETGTTSAVGSSATAFLAVTSSATAGYYVDWEVAFVISGAAYMSTITAYNNSTKQITFGTLYGGAAVPSGVAYSLIAPVYAKQVYGKNTPYEPEAKAFPTIWNNVNAFNNCAFIPRGTTSVINVTNAMIGRAQYGLWATYDDPYSQNWGGIDLKFKERLYASAVFDDVSPSPVDGSVWANTTNHTCLFWVYDSSDLAAVVAGSKTYDEIKPSSLFSFPLPYAGDFSKHIAAFDNTNNRLYIYERLFSTTNSGSRNLVHVYSCGKYI